MRPCFAIRQRAAVRFDARDISLGLSYVSDCSVLVVAEPLGADALAVAADAAAYHDAHLVAVVDVDAAEPETRAARADDPAARALHGGPRRRRRSGLRRSRRPLRGRARPGRRPGRCLSGSPSGATGSPSSTDGPGRGPADPRLRRQCPASTTSGRAIRSRRGASVPGIDLIRELGQTRFVEPLEADDDQLARLHDRRYIRQVRSFSDHPDQPAAMGIGPGDCPPFYGMHEASATIAGGSIAAVEAILRGDASHAFNPGGGLHHASAARASGFCIYNDVALGVAAARDAGHRVLYLDFDVHHGDGTQALFWDDPAGAHLLDPRDRPCALSGQRLRRGERAGRAPGGVPSTCRSSRAAAIRAGGPPSNGSSRRWRSDSGRRSWSRSTAATRTPGIRWRTCA